MSDPALTTTTPPTPEDLAADSATRERATVAALLAMLFYQGFAAAIISVAVAVDRHELPSRRRRHRTPVRMDLAVGPRRARTFAHDRSLRTPPHDPVVRRRDSRLQHRRRDIATSLLWFTIFQIALYAVVGAAGSGCVVMLSEELPIARRARGQSFGGLAAAVGAGLCVFLMPIFDAYGWSWRWMFVISAAGIAMLPAMARLLPESERWELSDASGINTRTRFYDVFQPLYRKRSVTMIVCALAGHISTTAANAFGYYHAVSVVGMSSAATSTMTIVAGGLGLLGFPLGAWTAERFGRVPTVVAFGIAITAGHLWYFWGPPPHFAWPF